MALTLSNATTEVRYAINEATALFWSDTEIENWIKEGCRIFSSKTLMVEDTQDITLVANQLSYAVGDHAWIGDAMEIYSAIYDDGSNKYKGLIKIHPRQLGNLASFTSGDPKYFCSHDRKVYIWPLTTAAIVTAGGLVTTLHAKETDAIADITDEFQHLPIIYAVGKCKQKDMKFAEANSLLSQFYQEINFERADKHARETDSLDKFRIPARGGGTESARG
ncbi:MAG: hypothetical protein ACXABY_08510 [Candidatus Thorarchaeota archaeon]|jgi:hypothetical protein